MTVGPFIVGGRDESGDNKNMHSITPFPICYARFVSCFRRRSTSAPKSCKSRARSARCASFSRRNLKALWRLRSILARSSVVKDNLKALGRFFSILTSCSVISTTGAAVKAVMGSPSVAPSSAQIPSSSGSGRLSGFTPHGGPSDAMHTDADVGDEEMQGGRSDDVEDVKPQSGASDATQSAADVGNVKSIGESVSPFMLHFARETRAVFLGGAVNGCGDGSSGAPSCGVLSTFEEFAREMRALFLGGAVSYCGEGSSGAPSCGLFGCAIMWSVIEDPSVVPSSWVSVFVIFF
jgi:hypothetical protein